MKGGRVRNSQGAMRLYRQAVVEETYYGIYSKNRAAGQKITGPRRTPHVTRV